jgi:IS30 family transposase
MGRPRHRVESQVSCPKPLAVSRGQRTTTMITTRGGACGTHHAHPRAAGHVWAQWRTGQSVRSIARDIGAEPQHLRRYFAATGGVRTRSAGRSARQLSLAEREEISRGLAAGHSQRRIATALGRPHSSISREVARNGGRDAYRAHDADTAAYARAKRPKTSKLAASPALRVAVERGLSLEWSPEQISHRLRLDHPDDPCMRISHEAIYLSLFVPHHAPLPRRLTQRLRTGRAMRYPKIARQPSGRGVLRDMVPLRQRPAEADDRSVPGHWEGDLVMGRRPSAIATLVERASRYTVLVALPGVKADDVHPAVRDALTALPAHLRRSLTWDRGREMAHHARLTTETSGPVYFCDTRSPWQRGTNENTNRLLRQYFPRAADLRRHDQAALDDLAARLNGRPRRTLGWRTPEEVYRWSSYSPRRARQYEASAAAVSLA